MNRNILTTIETAHKVADVSLEMLEPIDKEGKHIAFLRGYICALGFASKIIREEIKVNK